MFAEKTLGEAERSTLREPPLAAALLQLLLRPEPRNGTRSQLKVRSDVLRANRKDVVLDKVAGELGKVVSHLVTLDLNIDHQGARILMPPEGKSVPGPLTTISWKSTTIIFQRPFSSDGSYPCEDEQGEVFLAMEEDMDTLNLGAIDSDRVVKVASVRGPDKFKDLDEVLDATAFFPNAGRRPGEHPARAGRRFPSSSSPISCSCIRPRTRPPTQTRS